MAEIDSDTLDLTEDQIADEAEDQGQEGQPETDGEEAPEDEEETVVIEGEAAPASGEADTGLVKHLREELRRVARERDEARKTAPQAAPIEVGEKPTLAGCDFDEDIFEAELDQWKGRKAAAEKQVEDSRKTQQQAAEAWSQELESHHTKKAALKFRGVQEAEDVVTATLNDIQQAVIVKAAENSALVIYALGKNPAKLAEASKITDPLKLAAYVARLEGKLTVAKRGGPPEPERIARGGAPVAQGSDKKLDDLEKKAQRTGNWDDYFAYKRGLKSKG